LIGIVAFELVESFNTFNGIFAKVKTSRHLQAFQYTEGKSLGLEVPVRPDQSIVDIFFSRSWADCCLDLHVVLSTANHGFDLSASATSVTHSLVSEFRFAWPISQSTQPSQFKHGHASSQPTIRLSGSRSRNPEYPAVRGA
jgi:hypothetical protein